MFIHDDILPISLVLSCCFIPHIGSADTVVASAFALSVLSLIINYTLKRIVGSVVACLKQELSIEDIIESEKSMVQLLLENERVGSVTLSLTTPPTCTSGSTSEKAEEKTNDSSLQKKPFSKSRKAVARIKAEKRKKALKVVNRRRRQRRKGGGATSSSDEDGSSDSVSGGEGGVSLSDNDSTMEQLGEDIDLLMIDSLSESSNDERDDVNDGDRSSLVSKQSPPINRTSTGTKGRRNIVIAANFSNQVSSGSSNPSTNPSLVPNPSQSSSSSLGDSQPKSHNTSAVSTTDDDHTLRSLQLSTQYQEVVSKACEIVSKEKYMQCVKVFADWLVSYPSVLASCGHVSTYINTLH